MKRLLILPVLFLISACASQFRDLKHESYVYQGDYDDISSCFIRTIEDNTDRVELTNVRQLTHPSETRIGDYYQEYLMWQINVTKIDDSYVSVMLSSGSINWDANKRVVFAPKFAACGLDLT